MIKEDFVSFEVAKLLKEKGFNEPCKVWYSEYTSQFGGEKYTSIEFDDHNRFKKDYKFLFYAPTHQMAMKWLREMHKLSIEPFYMFPAIWEIDIKYIDKKTDLSEFEDIRDKSYNSYEEAVEAALKHCLKNLI